MKTDLNAFCGQFSTQLEPFVDEVGRALAEMPQREDVEELDFAVVNLQEVQQRLSALRDKVGGQRTFLLIFGPLKSGKSTLMNALAGEYVSEVSSLPAYPALVYVKNGPEQRIEATNYKGETREFPDNLSLADAVEADHTRLADALVAAENEGEDFEPERHCPEAIHRMDIEIPAAHLAESGSVLVDTPGLYSRMRFGYDQMTRDFRDTASCAIFVVKTDNLFFEKVFEEFEELLNSFSRVFLISNIDSSKKDLRPDGTLEASLESRDPDKIVDAFRSLSMSASVRGAIEDGRLKIYPIDLLQAASRTLGGGMPGNGMLADEATPDALSRDDGFDEFVSDLTGYLNSGDYQNDFMYDTLRQAEDLTSEAAGVVTGHAAAELKRSIEQLQSELEQERVRMAAVQALEHENWSEAFDGLRAQSNELLDALAAPEGDELESACKEQLSAWMDCDESWNELLEQRLKPQFDHESQRQAALVFERLREKLDSSFAGAQFSDSQLSALESAGLQAGEALDSALAHFGEGKQAGSLELDIDPQQVPVARGFTDSLLLRSPARIRQEIFGDNGNVKVPVLVKRKRLAGSGQEKLQAMLGEAASRDVPKLQRVYAEDLIEAHAKRCADALARIIAQRGERLSERIAAAEKSLKLRENAQAVMDRIKQGTLRFDGHLSELRAEFQPDGGALVSEI